MDPDLEFQGRLRDNGASLIAAAALTILVVIVGIGLLAGTESGPLTGATGSGASPAASGVATVHPTPTPAPQPAGPVWSTRDPLTIDPGAYYIAWDSLRVRLEMPAGWSSTDRGATLTNAAGTVTMTFYADRYDPLLVATDVCPLGDDATFVRTGPKASDLVRDLEGQGGIAGPDPVEVIVGTFPATKIVRNELLCRGRGPEGRLIWREDHVTLQCPERREQPCQSGSDGFGLLSGGTATTYVVDVNGRPLVIALGERGASPEDLAAVDAIVASIDIEPVDPVDPATGSSAAARLSLAVDGLPISFTMSAAGWGSPGGISWNKDLVGSQAAEAIVYWTTFPASRSMDPCRRTLGLTSTASAWELADAVAAAPGTDLVSGPVETSVAGHPALHVVVEVRDDAGGCDPGYFYTWPYTFGGAFWQATGAGDTIRVGIVDVDGSQVFVVGATHRDAGPDLVLTETQMAELDREIRAIVASITFD